HSYAKKPLVKFFGGKRLSEISTFDVEKYKLLRKEEKKQHGTINRELSLLSNLFTMAIEWRKSAADPTANVAQFKEPKGRNRYLTQEEGRKVLANCRPNLRLLCLAALTTGFRTSELKQTTWARVDFMNKSITVLSAYAKNDETRSVPLHPDLELELRQIHE